MYKNPETEKGKKMKRVAIMGARGFVGKSLTEYLKDKYSVFPITREQFSLLDGDAVASFVKKENIDVMIHCANQGGSRKEGYDAGASSIIENNLKMFFHMESLAKDGRKLISFGSGAQYQKARDLKKVREEEMGKVIPKDEYGFSKYVISRALQNPNVYNPIIFGLYGWHEDYTFKFISNAILKNLLHMPITINQNVVFDYLFIEDFLRLVEGLIEEEKPYREFNMTPTESVDLVTIAGMINSCSDQKSEIIVNNPGLNYEYTGNNDRLLKNFPDFSFTSYETGIQKLYEYYKAHLDELDTNAIREDAALKNCRTRK